MQGFSRFKNGPETQLRLNLRDFHASVSVFGRFRVFEFSELYDYISTSF